MSGGEGKLVVISGPSGVGKSTVVKQLVATCQLPLQLSVSATTRPKRPGEIDGENYFFLTHEQFQQRAKNDEFLEYAEVFGRGHWYGTPLAPVTTGLKSGKWIILEINVDGAMHVVRQFPSAITIFVHPGSVEELERRLRGRKTESEPAIQRRLDVATRELKASRNYQHIVINQTIEQTVRDICKLLTALHNGQLKVKSGEQMSDV